MSMTVQQVATAAGDRYATMRSAGNYPVQVVTPSGKTRNVTGAGFGYGLVLVTGDASDTLTVEQIVRQAGGDGSTSVTSHGNVEVTVRTRTGKIRNIVDARFNGNAVVLVTAK